MKMAASAKDVNSRTVWYSRATSYTSADDDAVHSLNGMLGAVRKAKRSAVVPLCIKKAMNLFRSFSQMISILQAKGIDIRYKGNCGRSNELTSLEMAFKPVFSASTYARRLRRRHKRIGGLHSLRQGQSAADCITSHVSQEITCSLISRRFSNAIMTSRRPTSGS